jgi:hydroxymethylpyrimidine/phosphomethylpyrimidine kinase
VTANRFHPRKPFVVLSLAGLDPSGGAGLLANVQTINRHGGHALGIVTLETVQDTCGVRKVVAGDANLVREQVGAAVEDIHPDAVHVGALGSLAMVETLGDLLRKPPLRGKPLVVDTIIRSTSGAPLLAPDALDAFCDKIISIATLITPNIPEFEILALRQGINPGSTAKGGIGKSGTDGEDLESALLAYGKNLPGAVLLKGGHLDGEPVDRLILQGVITPLAGHRQQTQNTHGTGCALAASLACHLAQGHDLLQAAQAAKSYVAEAMASAPGLGSGKGPLNLRMPGE